MSRYARHLSLHEIGFEGQRKISGASVLVVGAGGLGSPVLQYLTAAGIGHIGVVDHDSVALSNLQRQVLFNERDIGKNKAEAAIAHLQLLNSTIGFTCFPEKIDSSNAIEIISGFSLVVDCTDNFPTRYLLNDACVLTGRPYIYGAIHRFEGQVAVFNLNAKSANYRDLYPTPPSPGSVPTCEEEGVLGVLPGLIGTLQAAEVLKIVTESGEVLDNTLLMVDAWDTSIERMKIKPGVTRESIRQLIDYEDFCGLKRLEKDIREITVQELDAWRRNQVDFQLIDVREAYESEIVEIGGELMPMSSLAEYVDLIDRHRKVVIHCHHGSRSASVIRALESRHGYNNLYNLRGGIHAWALEIDNKLPTY